MKICINSEFGKLEGVILHKPGTEVENMTPENAERALYSDILNLSIASKEYAQLDGVLNKVTSVFYVEDLLSEVLKNEKVKLDLFSEISTLERVEFDPDNILSISPENTARLLIEGILLNKNSLTNYLSNERFLIKPLHNLFFIRDSAMGMNDHMLIGRMANPVREREALIMDTIFKHHTGFYTKILNPIKPTGGFSFNPDSTIEGGDFMVARDDVFVIGTGIRTSTQGIDFIIENIRQLKTGQHHIIVQELPKEPESFIHLDMVFTLLDTESCMIFEPILNKTNRLRTIHILIENREVVKIEERPDLLAALHLIGIDVKPVFCGRHADKWVQEREQWHSGANFFAFAPGKVIGYERNVHTISELSKNGFEVLKAADIIEGKENPDNYRKCVVTIAGSELARGGGGARCMTMPIRRAEVNW